MLKSWVKVAGLVIVVTGGVIFSACTPGVESLPLSFYIDIDLTAAADPIVLALDNPTGKNIFVPATWTGIAMYKKLATGTWAEYRHPTGYEPMHTTKDDRILYSIPDGTLEPGSYKLVIQGRIGEEGIPFSLETNFKLTPNGLELSNRFQNMVA